MNKLKDLWTSIIVPSILLMLFFVTLAMFESEIISSIILLLFIIITFTIKHNHREWLLVLIGIILGIVFEVGGDLIYKLQYWNSGMLFGLPLWLPLLWGFGFLIIHRVGAIIVKK
jgi:hypothetical protein